MHEKVLETIKIDSWDAPISKDLQQKAILALEHGKALYFPSLSFDLHASEKQFLSSKQVDPKSKNISYNLLNDKLGGTISQGEEAQQLKEMMKRYALGSRGFLRLLLPSYTPNITQARTSYRPVEVQGRALSYRKDDTRLHVDAFPSAPTKGRRIMRVFTNINPDGKPRVWRLGEPFSDVVKKMAPRVNRPIPGFGYLLQLLRITKDYRTAYDHYMLHMHDAMKRDEDYQKNVSQEEVRFPPGSTWIVYSDQVSHAAMAGQYMFEQTFHLPVCGLQDESTSPLRVLEKYFGRKLV